MVLVSVAVGLLACGSSPEGILPPGDPRSEGMVFVPGGPFLMGSSEVQIDSIHQAYGGNRVLYESEFPPREIHLEPYYMDRTEVTQADYKRFVDATGRDTPFVDREWAAPFNWRDATYPPGLADHPVVLVSYFDALEYCRWAGKSLPTEVEWEKAARGADGRAYPWGDKWDSSRLHSAAAWAGRELPTMPIWTEWWKAGYLEQLRGKVVTTKAVGSHPAGASPYGVLDLAGNVFEWVDSWFQPYPGSPYKNPEFGETYRVVRGGDWYLDRIYTRSAARLRSPPDHKVTTIGFRCVCREENVAAN